MRQYIFDFMARLRHQMSSSDVLKRIDTKLVPECLLDTVDLIVMGTAGEGE